MCLRASGGTWGCCFDESGRGGGGGSSWWELRRLTGRQRVRGDGFRGGPLPRGDPSRSDGPARYWRQLTHPARRRQRRPRLALGALASAVLRPSQMRRLELSGTSIGVSQLLGPVHTRDAYASAGLGSFGDGSPCCLASQRGSWRAVEDSEAVGDSSRMSPLLASTVPRGLPRTVLPCLTAGVFSLPLLGLPLGGIGQAQRAACVRPARQ